MNRQESSQPGETSEVVVERGRLYAELTSDRGEGGGLEAITIRNGRCRLHDVFESDTRFATHQTIRGAVSSIRSFMATFMASNPALVFLSRVFANTGTSNPVNSSAWTSRVPVSVDMRSNR